MSDELMRVILRSNKVIIPFETTYNKRQIFSIITCSNGIYASFSLIDSEDKYLGPVGMEKTDLPSESIVTWLDTQGGRYEAITPAKIAVTESSFFLDGEIETVIECIEISDQDGRTLRMSRNGATYPYGLVLSRS